MFIESHYRGPSPPILPYLGDSILDNYTRIDPQLKSNNTLLPILWIFDRQQQNSGLKLNIYLMRFVWRLQKEEKFTSKILDLRE